MIPLTTNPDGTVGVIDAYNPKDDFILEVNPRLLKEWSDEIMTHLGSEDVVYLSVHKHEDPMETTRCLTASAEYGGSLQVMVIGTDCDDVIRRGLK